MNILYFVSRCEGKKKANLFWSNIEEPLLTTPPFFQDPPQILFQYVPQNVFNLLIYNYYNIEFWKYWKGDFVKTFVKFG